MVKKGNVREERKGGSRWMVELARQNYQYLVEKMRQQETKRRVNIMKAVREQLRGRFMKLYRYFRHKRYGEPLPIEEKTDIEEVLVIEPDEAIKTESDS